MPVADTTRASSASADLTGRSQIGRNIAFAWGAYLIDIIAGFIVPRMVSDHLGQATLGIWDFAYNVAAYFALVQLTIGSSVIRFVARHRAAGDTAGLNGAVSTVSQYLRCASGVALVATLVTVWGILPSFSEKLGSGFADAQWVVLFFGLKISLLVWMAVYGAVISGCHRWDIHNSITAVTYALTTTATLLILFLGGGLRAMAIANFALYSCAEFVRRHYAFRVCPELRVRKDLASWPVFKDHLRYSAKGLVPRVADMLSNQFSHILIAIYLGPAALAVYSRPRRLIMAFRTLAAKAGYVLVPSSSALQARGDLPGVRSTLLDAPAGIAAVAIPAMAILSLAADQIMRFWMGESYVFTGLMPVLALGALPNIVQEPIWSVLAGLNRHGVIAIVKLIGSALAVALLLAAFSLGNQPSLLAAAWSLTIARLITDGILIPVTACRALKISFWSFYSRIYLFPLGCSAPASTGIALLLWTTNWGTIAISLASLAVSGWLYWRVLLPPNWRARLLRVVVRTRAAA